MTFNEGTKAAGPSEWYPPADPNIIAQLIDRAADGEVGRLTNSHMPALVATLDFQQPYHRPDQIEAASRASRRVFLDHLDLALAAWRGRLGALSDDDFTELFGTQDLMSAALVDDPVAAAALGRRLVTRIRSVLNAGISSADVDLARHEAAALELLDRPLGATGTWAAVSVELANSMFRALDHPVTRLSTKYVIDTLGVSEVTLPRASIESGKGRSELMSSLDRLAKIGAEVGLVEFVAMCSAGKRIVSKFEDRSDPYVGQFEPMIDWCERCQMRSAQLHLITVDSLVDFEHSKPSVPLFSCHECGFCGATRRIDRPVTFFNPSREQIIDCVPGNTADRSTVREALRAKKQQHRAQMDADAAVEYDAAAHIETKSIEEFIQVLHSGHAERERHQWLLLSFDQGTGMVVDPAKTISIQLTEAEVINARLGAPSPSRLAASRLNLEGVARNEEGDFEGAEQAFLEALKNDCNYDEARQNLAMLLIAGGREQEARLLLAVEPGGSTT